MRYGIFIDNRIRKDLGNIQEIAENIGRLGLLQPIVINKENKLLAGECRIRACESLGWSEIEVRMMDTRDAEHELNIEISENENRKAFSKAERVDYMRRLMWIETAKAEKRKKAGADLSQNSDEGIGRADDLTAKQFGIGRSTMPII